MHLFIGMFGFKCPLPTGVVNSETNEENVISKSKLYDQYIDYCDKMKIGWRNSKSIFGKNLSKYCEFDSIRRTNIDQKRHTCYQFPDKCYARKQFSKQVGMEIDWNAAIGKKRVDEVDKI